MSAEQTLLHLDEDALLARIQAGDKEACARCIDHFAPRIYGIALRLMENEADAEDVVQETFIAALKNIDDFEGRSSLGTWLYRIAYNTAMMKLRKPLPPILSVDEALTPSEEGLTVPQQLFDWCCLPETDFETEEVQQELEVAIRDLPEALRTVFVLRDMEGMSTKETADVLDISTAAVKKRLERARLGLRERLSTYFAASG